MTGPWHSLFTAVPEFKQVHDKIFLIFAGTTKEYALLSRPNEDVVKEIYQAKKRGFTKFVFAGSAETIIVPLIRKIHSIVELCTEIDPKDFFYHVTGFSSKEDYDKLAKEYNFKHKINLINTHHFEYVTNCNLKYFTTLYEEPYEVKIKPKKFVCFNKVHREHRLHLVAKMLESGLINSGFYSFQGAGQGWLEVILRTHTFNQHTRNVLEKHRDIFPIRLNITPQRDNPVDLQPDDIKYHTESYFSIVTETLFYNKAEEKSKSYILMEGTEGVFISEKTYKAIAFKHPFIVVGQAGILQALRSTGYKTFSPFIDETYDTITNSDERLEYIWREINRLCNLTDQQWLEWQNNVRDIVEYNYNLLKNRQNFINDDLAKLLQLFSN